MRSTDKIRDDFNVIADDSRTWAQLQTELLIDIRDLLLHDLDDEEYCMCVEDDCRVEEEANVGMNRTHIERIMSETLNNPHYVENEGKEDLDEGL